MIGNSILAQHLDDCECIQGDTMTLTYEFYDGEGNPLDLRRSKAYVAFCPYGQYKSPILIKEGIVSSGSPHIVVVNLSKEDTIALKDIKYNQQPVIVVNPDEPEEREYRRAQGDVIMYPAIYSESIHAMYKRQRQI